MALLQSLGHLIGGAAHTINNDVVQPIERKTPAPVANGLVHLWQLANPNSGANQGAALQQQTNKVYHFTPAFNQLVSAAHPSLNSQAFGPNGELTPQSKALGESFGTNPYITNKVQIAKGMRGVTPIVMQDALVHEGLHQQWAQASNPQKDQFFQAYNKLMGSNSQDAQNLKVYLSGRLHGYSEAPKSPGGKLQLDAGGVPIGNQAYSNIGNLSPTIQNEIHSFIPEHYTGTTANNPLTQYYSQFFQPSGAQMPAYRAQMNTYNTLQNLSNIVPSAFPGVNNKPDWLTSEQQ